MDDIKYYHGVQIHYKLKPLLGILKTGGIIVRKEKNPSGFFYFDNLCRFYLWVTEDVDKSHRNFHEVIPDDWQKFRLDIDSHPSEDILNGLIESLHRLFKEIKEDSEPEIQIYDNETSYHLIVSNYKFKNSKICYFLYQRLMEILHENGHHGETLKIDGGIYTPNHNLRLEGNSKTGERRYKINSKWNPSLSKFQKFELFKKGVITAVDECSTIDLDLPEDSKTSDSEENEHRCLEFNIPPHFTFRRYDSEKGILYLNRISPSYCNICKRIHEHENGYLDPHGTFRCFRRERLSE